MWHHGASVTDVDVTDDFLRLKNVIDHRKLKTLNEKGIY